MRDELSVEILYVDYVKIVEIFEPSKKTILHFASKLNEKVSSM